MLLRVADGDIARRTVAGTAGALGWRQSYGILRQSGIQSEYKDIEAAFRGFTTSRTLLAVHDNAQKGFRITGA